MLSDLGSLQETWASGGGRRCPWCRVGCELPERVAHWPLWPVRLDLSDASSDSQTCLPRSQLSWTDHTSQHSSVLSPFLILFLFLLFFPFPFPSCSFFTSTLLLFPSFFCLLFLLPSNVFVICVFSSYSLSNVLLMPVSSFLPVAYSILFFPTCSVTHTPQQGSHLSAICPAALSPFICSSREHMNTKVVKGLLFKSKQVILFF